MVQFYEYALNLVCAPYAQNFFLHLFLGPVPPSLNGIEPSTCPSWIAQEYVMPHGAGYGLESPADTNVSSKSPDIALPDLQAANNVPLVERDALPADFLNNAIRSSVPLTRHLAAHFPNGITPDAVCPFLAQNLHWHAFNAGASSRDEIPIQDIPIRVWVTQTEVTELRGGVRSRGKPTIIWSASQGKAGGLQKGELPQVEPKTDSSVGRE